MPDLRYHLISLIAVFLALAIGILLGVAMADRGIITERLQAEITDVNRRLQEQQKQISRRDAEIDRLQERTAEEEQILVAISEALISDRLLGVEVAVVAGPYADEEVFQDLQSDLSTAGANLTSVTRLDAPSDPGEVTSRESTTGLESTYAGTARNVMEASDESAVPPEVVVFVGGGEIPGSAPPGTLEALNAAQTEMFGVWRDVGIRIVAAESSTGRSDVLFFQDLGIPSVDNADEPAGRAAIIHLISTEDDGSYGTKDTASEYFPSPE